MTVTSLLFLLSFRHACSILCHLSKHYLPSKWSNGKWLFFCLLKPSLFIDFLLLLPRWQVGVLFYIRLVLALLLLWLSGWFSGNMYWMLLNSREVHEPSINTVVWFLSSSSEFWPTSITIWTWIIIHRICQHILS